MAIQMAWTYTASGWPRAAGHRHRELQRGRPQPATRAGVRRFLATLPDGPVAVALEPTPGWRFVVEELEAAGMRAHLAEPAETRAPRGPRRRAKTDRADAPHLRELLGQGRILAAWIPAGLHPGPAHPRAPAPSPGPSGAGRARPSRRGPRVGRAGPAHRPPSPRQRPGRGFHPGPLITALHHGAADACEHV
jgi:hypothetical protein